MQHGRTADAGAARTRRAASTGSLLVAAAACVAAVGVVVPATPASAAGTIPAPPVVGELATHIALEQLGKPYAWGGAGPDAFDCSGLTAYSWDTAAGADLSLVAATQASSDVVPTAGSSLEPGDLVFYDDPGVAGIAHVSLFAANDAGSVVESADNPALPVRLQPMGWWTSPPVAMGRPLVPAADAGFPAAIQDAGSGYDLLRANGGVDNFGAPWHGSLAGRMPIGAGVDGVGLANEPTTGGYWILSSDGGVSNFDAPWFGSPRASGGPGANTVANPAVAIAAGHQGVGYDVLRGNGGVDNFHTPWHGSLAGRLPAGTVALGLAGDSATGGYWILTSDGGVSNFDAPWFGSPRASGTASLTNPVVAIAAEGGGYAVLFAGGGVETFGVAWAGSLAGRLPGDVMAIALAGVGGRAGYRILESDGQVASFS